MKIILSTASQYAATTLKNKIIHVIKGKDRTATIDTWSYKTSADGNDIIYHNPPQYINEPTKNVIFVVKAEGCDVVFTDSCWRNPNNICPTHEMICYHTGRLTEILLAHFGNLFSSFVIEH